MYDVNKFNELIMDFILYTMMKKLIYLISLVSALSLCSCNDEDVVFPKSTAELIAEEIQSYNKSVVDVTRGTSVFLRSVSYEIKVPFIILKWAEDDEDYYLLENITTISYNPKADILCLEFNHEL